MNSLLGYYLPKLKPTTSHKHSYTRVESTIKGVPVSFDYCSCGDVVSLVNLKTFKRSV